MTKEFWSAAWARALRTVAQVLGASLPVDVPITVAMVKGADVNVLWAILAWFCTGLLSGLASILTSIATGLPEVYDGTITVRAYEDYDEDGSPIVDGEHCEACDLSQYVGDNADGDN